MTIFKGVRVVGLYAMKRRLASLYVLLLLLVPVLASARGLVPCGGEGEPVCDTCTLMQLINNVIAWLVAILGTIAAIIIVYAGFKLVTAGGNGHVREEAKEMITNILIGYTIVLAGWLVIDTALKALLNEGTFGVWNEVQCYAPITPTDAPDWRSPDEVYEPNDGLPVSRDRQDVYIGPGTNVSSGGTGVLCPPASRACGVTALQRYGLTESQARVMSCIAMTESSGNPSTPPYNQNNPGSNSTACGTFQIVGSTWRQYARGTCADHRSNCQNAQCNAQVMAALVRANGYNDWTCPNCNRKAASCVSRYSQ